MKHYLLTAMAAASALSASAQLAKDNPCKFLGNITTSYNWVEYCDPQDNCGLKYIDYWDQVTNENASKWGSVHQGWGKFNWENSDRAYKYCKEHGIIFKFHALIWGSQAPSWIKGLSAAETRKAIEEWYDEVARHYPDLEIIDVVNEAIYVNGNNPDYHSPYKDYNIIEALGGSKGGYPNTQSYDWIAEAFRMARKRWPNAILIYNDYNTFKWQKTEFINLINGLKACGAPIDAAGCQSHDLTDMSGSEFKAALEEIHNKTQLPIYITEYDLGTSNDAHQKTQLEAQFPTMWEADYVPGVTFWGWIYGKTWTTDGNSGLVKNCQDRPAFTWLKQYMASDRAKNARATVCGKGGGGPVASIAASKELVVLGDSVELSATLGGDITDVKNVKYMNGNVEIKDKWVSPFKCYWTPDKVGEYQIIAIINGENKSQSVTIKVVEPNKPYGGTAAVIPGIIEAENYDEGVAGLAYYDKSEGNSCDNVNDTYRSDDVDIKEKDGGYALGNCQEGEWMAYTVDVQEDGEYEVTMMLGEGNDSGKLTVEIDGQKQSVTIEKTGEWGTFGEIELKNMTLTAGTKEMKITIDQDWIDLDWIKFECKSCKQEVDTTEASVALHKNTRVAVYPNPAKETITIAGVKGFKTATLINMLGVAVLTSETQVISVSNLPSGAYIVKIDAEEGEIVRNVVIKK